MVQTAFKEQQTAQCAERVDSNSSISPDLSPPNPDPRFNTIINANDDQLSPPSPCRHSRDRFNRAGLFVASCFYTLLFVGAFFGWGPMQLMLEENDAFASKCDGDDGSSTTATTCPEQTAALLNVNLVATLTQIGSPLLGQIADVYGPRKSAYVMTAFFWTGITLLLVKVSISDTDWLLYPAFIFIVCGTWLGGLLTVQVGMYFKSIRIQSRVIVILNGVFDSGTMTYLGMWGIYQLGAPRLTLPWLIGIYWMLSIIILGVALYFWNVAVPEHTDQGGQDKGNAGSCAAAADTAAAVEDRTANPTVSQFFGSSNQLEPNNANGRYTHEKLPIADNDINSNAEPDLHASGSSYIPIKKRSPHQQLTSAPALLLGLFFGIQVASNQWTLATARDFLAHLGDDEVGNRYLTIFTLLTPASLLGLPFVDRVLKRFGMIGGFQAINLLGLSQFVIKLASTDLDVQVLGFLLFSFYRCFLFGVTFSFVPTLLSGQVVGKATGFLYMMGGLASILNVPLANIAIEELDGDFFLPNLVYACLILPCFLIVHLLKRSLQRETIEGTQLNTQEEPQFFARGWQPMKKLRRNQPQGVS